jgi:hypothetical protein
MKSTHFWTASLTVQVPSFSSKYLARSAGSVSRNDALAIGAARARFIMRREMSDAYTRRSRSGSKPASRARITMLYGSSPRGAARRPHRHGSAAALATRDERLGQDLADERAQLAALAEEVGLVGGDLVDQRGELAVAAATRRAARTDRRTGS